MRSNLNIKTYTDILNVLKNNTNKLDFSYFNTQIDKDASNPWQLYSDTYSPTERVDIYFSKYNEQNKRCAISKLPFVIISSSREELCFSKPSVDRIYSRTNTNEHLNHTKNNTQLIWNLFNRAKLDDSNDEFNKKMSKRYNKWKDGYYDVEIIFPKFHSENWLEDYICKNDVYYDNYNIRTINEMKQFLCINKRKPNPTIKEENNLLIRFSRLNRQGAKDRSGKECLNVLNEFRETQEYKDYFMSDEEKCINLIEKHKSFCLTNSRLPSTSKCANEDEQKLAKKFCDIALRVENYSENKFNSHYKIFFDYINSDLYKKYKCTTAVNYYFKQNKLKQWSKVLSMIGDGILYKVTFKQAQILGLIQHDPRPLIPLTDFVNEIKFYANNNNIKLPELKFPDRKPGQKIICNIIDGKIYHSFN